MMNARCAQGLSTVQILIRRWIFRLFITKSDPDFRLKTHFTCVILFVQCSLLKQMLNSFLKHSVERFVITPLVNWKVLFLLDVSVTTLLGLLFRETSCLVQVYRLRLLGDYHHSTRIAFVEFVLVIASSSLLC